MGPVSAQLLDELGYDPDDGIPDVRDVVVDIGEIVRARDGAAPVAVARLGSGKLVVVVDECPHDGGRISDGFVDGERLVCARHNWELEVTGNRCKRAPSALAAPCGGPRREVSSALRTRAELDPAPRARKLR
jgi:phenylpropionate dioxygenase-like ring-hydroxylating dioxygenase large terminal subunit